MKTIELNRQYKNSIVLERSKSIIYLNASDYPYLEVTSVNTPNILTNSREKTINGTFTGSNIVSIQARNHYPHSVGSGWCHLSPNIFYYNNTFKIAGSEFSIGPENYRTANKTDGTLNILSNSVVRENCFLSAPNGAYSEEAGSPPYAMRYDLVEPYAPTEEDGNYYADRIKALGAESYIPFTTPSSWTTASIDSVNKTFSVDILMQPFWYFQDTPAQQKYLNWKQYLYDTEDIDRLYYDARVQAVELQITATFKKQTVKGSRWIYIWHCPQAWSVRNIHKIEKYTGVYNGPSDPVECGGWLGSCSYYQTGLTASGGSIEVSCGSSGESVTFDKILSIVRQPACDSVSIETGVFDISQIKRAWWIWSDGLSYDAYATNPDSPPSGVHCQEIDITKITLDNGFLVSDEFLSIIDNGASICFIIDYTDYIMGTTDENQTVLSVPSDTYKYQKWCVVGTSCDDCHTISAGEYAASAEEELASILPEEGYKTSGSVSIDLDGFDTGSNKEMITRMVDAGVTGTYLKNKASDGDFNYTMAVVNQTSPYWYQNYYDLTSLPLFGYAGKTIDTYFIYNKVVNDIILDGKHSGLNPNNIIVERVKE